MSRRAPPPPSASAPATAPRAARPTASPRARQAAARRSRGAPYAVDAALWIAVDGRPVGGPGRVALLRAVAEHGSITQAAKSYGISYKGAWDAIDAMNQAAGAPLVERVSGGRGGGATRLTAHGLRLVERFEQVAAVHRRFVGLLSAQAMDLDQDFSLLKLLNMKTSARNQWVGRVAAIRAGAVNDEVELALPGGARLTAVVTRDSTDALGLRLQQTAIALVKASAVLLATGLGTAAVSARNRFDGTVRAVKPGAVNAEVTLEAAGGFTVVAIVTQASVDALGLAPGQPATALVQASDVLLATVD